MESDPKSHKSLSNLSQLSYINIGLVSDDQGVKDSKEESKDNNKEIEDTGSKKDTITSEVEKNESLNDVVRETNKYELSERGYEKVTEKYSQEYEQDSDLNNVQSPAQPVINSDP